MTDKQLTSEAKEAIRNYMVLLVAPFGVFVSVLSFVIGFGIKEIAVKNAEIRAQQLEVKLAELTKSAAVVDDQLTKVKKNVVDAEVNLNQLSRDPDRFNKAMKQFAEQSDELNLAAELTRIREDSLKWDYREFRRLQMGNDGNGVDVPKAANGEYRQTFSFPGQVLATGLLLRSSSNPETLDEIAYLNVDIATDDPRNVVLRCRSIHHDDRQKIPKGDLGIDGSVWAIFK
jgi:hypothetical protein